MIVKHSADVPAEAASIASHPRSDQNDHDQADHLRGYDSYRELLQRVRVWIHTYLIVLAFAHFDIAFFFSFLSTLLHCSCETYFNLVRLSLNSLSLRL